MAAQGNWKLGTNGCRGASWSEEHLGASSLTATLQRRFLFFGRLRASWTSDPFFTVWYADKYTRVLLYVVRNTPCNLLYAFGKSLK